MKGLVWCLLPLAAAAAPERFARLGDFDGAVEVQLDAASDWQAARRNLPLRETSWVRTDVSGRAEIELDDGSVLRLGPDSLAALSDYTRLSSGQRITVVSLDHGVAYFTGMAEASDTVLLALPGAQIRVREEAHLRLEARDPWTWIAASGGSARFTSPAAEFDLREGQIVKLDPAHPARFYLYSEIPALETDRWAAERDRLMMTTTSAAHVPGLRYGLADLDAWGTWLDTALWGTIWKPKTAAGWTPYRNGKWAWYNGLGYTWISDDPWGWLPYHYGRWLWDDNSGWAWSPENEGIFLPGEVYWLKSAHFAGWGPLAPGENWKAPAMPRLFLNGNTTYAAYGGETHELDPSGFAGRPKDPLSAAAFVDALPSPAFPAARLKAFRQPLRAGLASIISVSGMAAEPPEPPRRAASPTAAAASSSAPAPVVVVNQPAVEVPVEVDVPVPVPVYLGIIVVAPPGYKPPQKKPNEPKSTNKSKTGK